MIRVLICDDHRLVREGLKLLLGDTGDIEVAAEADGAVAALAQIRAAHEQARRVDVVLLDIAMNGRDGLDVLKQVRSEFPLLPVLMLSTYPERQYALRCLKLGARGYLTKHAEPEQIVDAIRKVAAGQVHVGADATDVLVASLVHEDRRAPHESLSQREFQVFRMLAAGQSVGAIAQALCLSSNTVSTYRARILEKTGARNDVELALYAVRHQQVAL
jgi:two-component system invasion response regulator UvrY